MPQAESTEQPSPFLPEIQLCGSFYLFSAEILFLARLSCFFDFIEPILLSLVVPYSLDPIYVKAHLLVQRFPNVRPEFKNPKKKKQLYHNIDQILVKLDWLNSALHNKQGMYRKGVSWRNRNKKALQQTSQCKSILASVVSVSPFSQNRNIA